jgi:hypothetical protein
MSCTQAKACGYHQNGITTQPLKGEGEEVDINVYFWVRRQQGKKTTIDFIRN